MVFDKSEIDQFLTDGYIVLRDGFPRGVAKAGRSHVWNRIGESWSECETSGQPMVHLRENFKSAPFDRVMNRRLALAFDELLGPGRWSFDESFGWWPVLLPGFPGPGGWHIDGISRHRFGRPEKGLTTLFLFSDIGEGDGGTPLVPSSHRDAARLLAAAEPTGLSGEELIAKMPPVDASKIVSIAGNAGDVAFLHPYLVHGFGPNAGSHIRFACNPFVELKSPLQLERRDEDCSPVERAMRHAPNGADDAPGRF